MTTPTTVQVKLKLRNDTSTNWIVNNPVLLAGELGRESNTGKIKIGNGTTAWNSLAYQPFGALITNDDISATAEIAVSKLADGAARQLLQTDAAGTGVEWTSNVDIPGTLDVTGAATFDANVTVQGDLTVNGTTTTINTENLTVEDKNITIANVTSPTDVTADGAGITIKGATDKTFNWVDATDSFTASENIDLASGKSYRINGVEVLSASGLGSGVQITSANIANGTIVNEDVNASAAIAGTKIAPDFGSQTVTTTGVFSAAAGAAATPSVTFTGDLNTGIYSPGADQVAISTAGTGRLFVDASGRVGIGTLAPGTALDTNGISRSLGVSISGSSRTGGTAAFDPGTISSDLNWGMYFRANTSPGVAEFAWYNGAGSERLRITSTGALNFTGAGTAGSTQAVSFNGSAPVNSLVINSSGLVGIGTSAPSTTLHVVGTGLFRSAIAGTSATLPSESTALSVNDGTVYGGSPSVSLSIGASNHDAVNNNTAFQWKITTPSASASAGTRFTVSSRSFDGTSTYTETPRLTILSGGNVGIGTTSPQSPLHILSTSSATYLTLTANDAASNGDRTVNIEAIRPGVAYNNLLFNANSHIFAINGTGTERARIDSSGRLLVGTSSAATTFFGGTIAPQIQLEGTNNNTSSLSLTRRENGNAAASLSFGKTRGGTTVVAADDGLGFISFEGSDGTNLIRGASITAAVDGTPGANTMPGRLIFSTTSTTPGASPTERMRIRQDGNILFGKTALDFSVAGIQTEAGSTSLTITRTSGDALTLRRNTDNGDIVSFYRDGTKVGSISVTTSATAFNTSSDYRLKENVTAVTGAIARLQELKPSRFNFIADPGKTVDGFLAHEVQTIVPEAITGEKDAVDDDGNPLYQGIDQSKLVPLLTAALQETVARIEQLEAAVATLQAQ